MPTADRILPDTKVCSSCRLEQPVTSFWRRGSILQAYCKRCHNRTSQEQYAELTYEVIQHYGGVCICCGEDNPAFLTIAHINDDGAAQKKLTGNKGKPFWQVKKNDFPDDLTLECFNCNCAKALRGACPHQEIGIACEL